MVLSLNGKINFDYLVFSQSHSMSSAQVAGRVGSRHFFRQEPTLRTGKQKLGVAMKKIK